MYKQSSAVDVLAMLALAAFVLVAIMWLLPIIALQTQLASNVSNALDAVMLENMTMTLAR
jgi:hypothetical protein